MKMKRVTLEIVLECPANKDPFSYVSISGGQTVKRLQKNVTKEEALGEVDTPWGQKMREFYTVRKLIQDGVLAALKTIAKDYRVRVYGNTTIDAYYSNRKGFSYWMEMDRKSRTYGIGPRSLQGMTFELEQGVVTVRVGEYATKIFTTISLSDPNFVDSVKNMILKRLKK